MAARALAGAKRHTGGRVAMMPRTPALTRAVKAGELTAAGRNGGQR
jgi:hypothetical protein